MDQIFQKKKKKVMDQIRDHGLTIWTENVRELAYMEQLTCQRQPKFI
jgi:hypothetical protein